MVLDREPRDLRLACAEADVYGVGLLIARNGEDPEVIVAPESYRARRMSARAWWFVEEVYRAFLSGRFRARQR